MTLFGDGRKSFLLHRDSHGFFQDTDTVYAEYQHALGTASEELEAKLKEINYSPKQVAFFRRVRPNFNDPMTLYYVLSAMVEQRRGTYIRPTYLVSHLNKVAKMYLWDTGLVGRMLAGIWEACRQNYMETDDRDMEYIPSRTGDGEVIPDDKRLKSLPVALGRDAQGKYYVVDPKGGNEGFLWLLAFRDIAHKLAYKALIAEYQGELEAEMGKFNIPYQYYVGISPDPIRSAQAFRFNAVPRNAPRPVAPDYEAAIAEMEAAHVIA